MVEMLKNPKITELIPDIQKKDKYTSIEILSNIKKIKAQAFGNNMSSIIKKIKKHVTAMDKQQLVALINIINSIIEKDNLNLAKINHQGKNKKELTQSIALFIDFSSATNPEILLDKRLKFDISIEFLNSTSSSSNS
jgi:hypothetical protein